MTAPMQGKVGHVGKQPINLNGELGSVSRISVAMRMENIKYGENLCKSGAPSTVTVGSEREKWMRVVLYKAGRILG